jgi:hypothetical protein
MLKKNSQSHLRAKLYSFDEKQDWIDQGTGYP